MCGRSIEIELPALRELHDGDGRRHGLRQRREIEDGIGRHRFGGRARHTKAAGHTYGHTVRIARHDDRAGKMAIGDLGGNDCVDRGGRR